MGYLNQFKRFYRNIKRRYFTVFIIIRLLIPILLTVLALLTVTAVMILVSVLRPGNMEETVKPELYYLPTKTVEWTGYKGETQSGWLIVKDKRAPLIFLCHGYGRDSNRSRLLNLARRLMDAGYNLMMFNFRGHGGTTYTISSLGYREAEDLKRAIETAQREKWVDYPQMGVFGISMGAYASMIAARGNPAIKAMALDSVYGNVPAFLRGRVEAILGMKSSIVYGVVSLFFDVYFMGTPSTPPIRANDLSDKAVLFLVGPPNQPLSAETKKLEAFLNCKKYEAATPAPRDTLVYGDEIQRYDELIVNFFLTELPIPLEAPKTDLPAPVN
ncbi:MAG: alpha/beta fold hydrolase [Acidobacteria bacterium]|nr:alpha/beta fold hydrolase [Acidobacteriota bacterium]